MWLDPVWASRVLYLTANKAIVVSLLALKLFRINHVSLVVVCGFFTYDITFHDKPRFLCDSLWHWRVVDIAHLDLATPRPGLLCLFHFNLVSRPIVPKVRGVS